ncbi:Glyoxalase/bleomycin resistance protein/dioxygenase [Chthoniobacter flavus Ellin428]|uniref:Glyoxalase/bleomycin resistance protein/dioxygenase n=1 Tax=Chthoniobacter flavus Ellin428 TaxID=497964 RepID=B4CUJ2_9BACT|nr:VOC family protein [Chthoniobacter flavus]EDY22230.1 Glyoxalase/bleomycin resistance protein/dioxygenase [Chthoniobacter flavus Ellin428]TCO94745.1 hypothetical protein EV701_102214 [Chthoniobacter flavus]
MHTAAATAGGDRHDMSEKHNPVGWFEIYVQDVNRAKAFYEKTFTVKLESLGGPGVEMWAWPMDHQAPGCTGALVKMEGKDSGVGGVIIYFPVEDCGAGAELAEKNGGRIQKKKSSIGEHGFISLVVDTEGNMIGLHSMK